MTRRDFILMFYALTSATVASRFLSIYSYKFLSKIPTKDAVIIKNGWILKVSDL